MTRWKVKFAAQKFDCDSYDRARTKVRELLDAGIWWITLTTFEPPPPVPPVPKARKKTKP